MASKKKKSESVEMDEQGDEQVATATSSAVESTGSDAAGEYVGQWNQLVSTTNWEKGRIICQWREAQELSESPATAYSDEAWAQLVGGVTSQHVGRLRRVFQRFGPVFEQYDGLYWSHFQAALDWTDAEMWLEGAIRNDWSVSQMRGKRWETLGNAGDPPADPAAAAIIDEDAASEDGEAASAAVTAPNDSEAAPWESDGEEAESDSDGETSESSSSHESIESPVSAPKAKDRKRLGVEVDDLPDDLADAFEQFKLAIIAQRRLSWSETTPEAVIECLDALKQLALAPSDD
jgi:hypothetical protein